VCVELLTGRPALGDDDSGATYEARRTDVRPTPRTKGANISEEVEALFRRALAVRVEERHANVAEFWDALCVAAAFPTPQWLSRSLPPPSINALQPSEGPVISGKIASPVALPQKSETGPGSLVTPIISAGARKRSRLTTFSYVLLGVAGIASVLGAAAWHLYAPVPSHNPVGTNDRRGPLPPKAPASSPATQTATEVTCEDDTNVTVRAST